MYLCCVYLCVYIYLPVCVYVPVLRVPVYVDLSVCMYVFTYIMCTCVCVCIYLCVFTLQVHALREQVTDYTHTLQSTTATIHFCIEALKESDPASFMEVRGGGCWGRG